MSATKHGIACHCSRCHEFNILHGKANELIDKMLVAKKAGRNEELDILCTQLEETNSQIDRLGDELNR